ncbi:MAG: tetraacyldisaccharide 4'-kinase [Endomicrobium sp.]|jgi:tetraacyldisaccharide 4'-kinase|nr:tetraacyldisaccharide 4'-kinase [Endomicrobium sp.]
MKLLYPLSLIYSGLYKLDKKFSNSKKILKPVISIGNITCGGNGKTPIVIELLNFLVNNNIKPVVLTRGYMRKSKIPLVLKNGALGTNVLDSGDEPLLIARSVSKSVIIVGADRYGNALRFENEINPDVYVLDDGFQHWNLQRDLDIVCINAANPFGNGMLIPAGSLREPSKTLDRAGFVIITNSDMVSYGELQKLKKTIFDLSGKSIAVTYYGDFKYKTIDLNEHFNIDLFKYSDVYSLSAIGFADGFKHSIKKSGIKIKDSIVLRDHSSYNNETLKKIVNKKAKDSYFIITAKDAIKYQNIDASIKERLAVLTVRPQFIMGKEQWEQEILKCLPCS